MSEFIVNTYTFKGCHHTDASMGVGMNYIARMKRGTSRFCGADFELTFEADDMFFIPRGCKYHSYWSGSEIVWDSFGFSALPEGLSYRLQRIEPSPEIGIMFDKILEQTEIDADTLVLLYTLIGRVLPTMKSDNPPKNPIIEMASGYMRANPAASIPEVAKYCHVSETSLYSAFRSLGTTPVETRLNIQLDKAILLLSTTDLTVDVISDRCGFNSPSYFYRVLRRLKGHLPSDYRHYM